MAINSRQELIEYCLRRLGHPVIEINVDEDQVEDRIDDALQYFQEYHFDGVERTYIKHQVTGATLHLTGFGATNFTIKEPIVGATSGARAIIYAIPTSNTLTVAKVSGTFTASEIVTGETSGYSGTLSATNFYEPGDIQNGYVAISDDIIGLVRLFPVNGPSDGTRGVNNIFDLVYQFRLNDMYNLLGSDMIYYTQIKQHLSMLDMLLVGTRSIRYNRKNERLYIDVMWDEVFKPGDFVVAEAYSIIDPETFTKVYNDLFLKRYATALIKRQWGENMKKFDGIQLPGGVTLKGDEIYNEAVSEIQTIEQEMQSKVELPVDFMVG